MNQKYIRKAIEVECVKYKEGAGLEDGFEFWKDVVLRGYTDTERIIQVIRADGSVLCPFIQSSRGVIFIKYGDYIITEADGDKHCCGEDKFVSRYELIE